MPEPRYLIWTWRHEGCFWCADRSGYTPNISHAGRYTRTEAEDILRDGFPGSKVAIGETHARLLEGLSHEEIIASLIQWRTL